MHIYNKFKYICGVHEQRALPRPLSQATRDHELSQHTVGLQASIGPPSQRSTGSSRASIPPDASHTERRRQSSRQRGLLERDALVHARADHGHVFDEVEDHRRDEYQLEGHRLRHLGAVLHDRH